MRFGVAVGAEAVAGAFEPAAQLAEVVDLAVEDDPDRAVFVGHRLMPAGQVDDRQPPMAQGHARRGFPARLRAEAGGVDALVVRPAMREHVDHPPERGLVDGLAGSVQTAPVMPHMHDSQATTRQTGVISWNATSSAPRAKAFVLPAPSFARSWSRHSARGRTRPATCPVLARKDVTSLAAISGGGAGTSTVRKVNSPLAN